MRSRIWLTLLCAALVPLLLQSGRREAAGEARVTVTRIRHWTHAQYTRVVVDLSGSATYNEHLLPADPTAGKGRRLYFDIHGATLDPGLRDAIPIGDGLLRRVRAAQHAPEVVRVVLDIEQIEDYKAFRLPGPDRIVIDVRGGKRSPKPPGEEKKGIKKSAKKSPSRTVRTVVIDPGHGGKDPGAVGTCGLHEKEITLAIAKRLKRRLDGKKGIRAILTRKEDRYLSLEERTSIANAEEADIFISIHINASKDRSARGIETYYLDNTTSRGTRTIAARENFTTEAALDDLQYILADLLVASNVEASSELAERVQRGMVKEISSHYSGVQDHGVKTALFFVLVGAEMPAILMEAAFITNPTECKRLRSSSYLDRTARAMEKGILAYLESDGGRA